VNKKNKNKMLLYFFLGGIVHFKTGKILSDDVTVEECHFAEKDFIVVMEMKV
jgi:hypothetical protein